MLQVRELEAISQRSKALFDDVSRETSLLHSSRSFVRYCVRSLYLFLAVSMTLHAYTHHPTRVWQESHQTGKFSGGTIEVPIGERLACCAPVHPRLARAPQMLGSRREATRGRLEAAGIGVRA